MKTIDIVEGFNKFFVELYPNRGFFVSKLNVEQGKISKLYKTYTLEVWYVDGKFKSVILISKVIGKTTDDEESFNSKVNSELSTAIFDWIGSEEYQYVLSGEYDKYKNE